MNTISYKTSEGIQYSTPLKKFLDITLIGHEKKENG